MSTSSLHTLAKVPSGGALADALAASLAGAPFLDTTFYACAQRLPPGEHLRPRAVHANSRILKAASPYFNDLLSDKPSEDPGATATRGAAPQRESKWHSHPEQEDDAEVDSILSLPSSPGSVISLESMSALESATAEIGMPEKPSDVHNETMPMAPADGTRVVHLDSVPASTLEVAIFYIYTGEVYFLPLRSRGESTLESAEARHAEAHPGRPVCSPKSMYHFAHKAGLNELRQLAEENLYAQLDSSNIFSEFFSPFSSRYPSILERQLDLLLRKYWTPDTKAALAPLVARVVSGELPHAAPALTMLLHAIPASPVPAPSCEDNLPPSLLLGPGLTAAPTSASGQHPPPCPPFIHPYNYSSPPSGPALVPPPMQARSMLPNATSSPLPWSLSPTSAHALRNTMHPPPDSSSPARHEHVPSAVAPALAPPDGGLQATGTSDVTIIGGACATPPAPSRASAAPKPLPADQAPRTPSSSDGNAIPAGCTARAPGTLALAGGPEAGCATASSRGTPAVTSAEACEPVSPPIELKEQRTDPSRHPKSPPTAVCRLQWSESLDHCTCKPCDMKMKREEKKRRAEARRRRKDE